jgi:hypothetical protein
MRTLRTRHIHQFLRSGDLSEQSMGELKRPRRENQGVSVHENPEADNLDSWKEIAAHLKRTVRTVQRWERCEGLPVHRHLHQRGNSVYAHKSELNEWWNHEPRSLEIEPLRVSSEGSRRQVSSPQVLTVTRSKGGSREAEPTSVEGLQEPQIAVICSPVARTGHVVTFRRVRIRIVECLIEPGLEETTRNAKAACRSLSLAAASLTGQFEERK